MPYKLYFVKQTFYKILTNIFMTFIFYVSSLVELPKECYINQFKVDKFFASSFHCSVVF